MEKDKVKKAKNITSEIQGKFVLKYKENICLKKDIAEL